MNSQPSSNPPMTSPQPEGAVADVAMVCGKHDVDMFQDAAGEWFCHPCRIDAMRDRELASGREEALRAQGARKQAEIEARLGSACIPTRYRELDFGTYPVKNEKAQFACNTLRSYAAQFAHARKHGTSVLLLGNAGTGKTGLALSLANAVVRDHGMTAVYMKAYGAIRHQRDTWGRKGRTERDALDDLVQPDLLVLDEVGTNMGSAAEMAMLFEVIDGRYGERRPTVLISNLPMDDYESAGQKRPGLRTFLGPRVIDRFKDDRSFTLSFDWPSLRGGQQG